MMSDLTKAVFDEDEVVELEPDDEPSQTPFVCTTHDESAFL